jgi:hypothetical protein
MVSVLAALSLLALGSTPLEINVDTEKGEIRTHDQALMDISVETLTKVLGKPSRIERKTHEASQEMFTFDGKPPGLERITVEEVFVIYDELGLLFWGSARWGGATPTKMFIRFPTSGPSRSSELPKIQPKKSFRGTFRVNKSVIDPTRSLGSFDSSKTDGYPLWDISLYPLLTGSVVDGLTNGGQEINLRMLFDDGEHARPSWVILSAWGPRS